ncbi:bifunctional phosphopantothenoylcysteine decarboxylase/phosphopantothenate--cysteine ligase CoaBC [Weissella paramesenteroides]|nr:bifunctional phosphopantothenoylcysteine decarboxylase/phosphopantothenate--cysteine ligase CoaBC [Weissella paramesenteroides]KAA8437906.1 bifunctional phosphopantothenoylcysteine decarboxylase/phosphopantothenate--cysteine ligase CoaBC [Weissella paramesenteroides]
MFSEKNIVLIVSGGIAAYKSAIFARLLIKEKAHVKVVMTKSATEFITPKTMAVLTNEPVLTDLFSESTAATIDHISVADWADYIFVVPATANIIAKIANGIADDAASTVLAARHTPLIIAPAMNENMYLQKAVQKNLQTIMADGDIVIQPAEGFLAEGYAGKGRLPEPADILAYSELKLYQKQGVLKNKHVVISAGGTIEPIDPVRYISNRSSGKMGYALAKAAAEQGAQVTLVSASTTLPDPIGIKTIHIQSAQDLSKQMIATLPTADVIIMAAAVSDYRVGEPAVNKLKKQASGELTLTLVENPDILAQLGAMKKEQYLVGFAAETQNLLAYAQTKLVKKNADMLIANDVSKHQVGFGYDTNQVTILTKDQKPEVLPLQDKLSIARKIMQKISEVIN